MVQPIEYLGQISKETDNEVKELASCIHKREIRH